MFSFEVSLSLADDDSAIAPRNVSDILRQERVLIVDNSAAGAGILKEMFDSWGIYCKTAISQELALQAIGDAAEQAEPFSTVVIDQALSSSGAEPLIQAIRELQLGADIHIVVQSSIRYPLHSQDPTDSGSHYDGHVMKPVYPSELLNCMSELSDESLQLEPRGVAASPEQTAAEARIAANIREGARVLVVEDSPINQVCTEAMLNAVGCEVVMVENGQEALEKFSSQRFDLVLMDCMMPLMDGYEATRQIRALSDLGRTIPIIAMTANALKGDREKCIEAGMSDYISKPVHQQLLVATLDEYLAA